MSVTAETSHVQIGPCGPTEQSVDSCRHNLMAARSSDLDFGAHPAGRYDYRDHTGKVRVGIRTVRMMLRD